jgi:hypothetical protein
MKKIILAILIATAPSAWAQESTTKSSTKGMAWGAGIGALVGGVYGRHGSDALIGAAVGTGIGYVIGNNKDKKKAQQMSAQSPDKTHSETGSFAGTSWQLQDWEPKTGKETFKDKTFTFGSDGWVTTTTTNKDGRKATVRENYRVVDDTLVINRNNYIVNCKFALNGDQLTVNTSKLRAILKKI